MAKEFGLEAEEAHMEELFLYIQKIWPALKRFYELDLKDLEPFMPVYSFKE